MVLWRRDGCTQKDNEDAGKRMITITIRKSVSAVDGDKIARQCVIIDKFSLAVVIISAALLLYKWSRTKKNQYEYLTRKARVHKILILPIIQY